VSTEYNTVNVSALIFVCLSVSVSVCVHVFLCAISG